MTEERIQALKTMDFDFIAPHSKRCNGYPSNNDEREE